MSATGGLPGAVGFAAGTLAPYGGETAPAGWLLCDGTAVSRTTYAALFAVIGEAFGVGDGATTFNLPDLRGRFPLGKAAAGTGSTLGGTGGAIDHTHAAGTLANAAEAAHTHTVTPADSPNVVVTAGTTVVGDNNPVTSAAGASHNHAISGSSAAGNAPFQAVNFIIKT